MKIRSIALLALVLATAGTVRPAHAADPLLVPSITPFQSVPNPMSSVDDAQYYGVLRSIPVYIGYAPGIEMWFRTMKTATWDTNMRQDSLKKETDFYIESVDDLGGIVSKRLKVTTQSVLDGMNESGHALELILAYKDNQAIQMKANAAEAIAWAHIRAAIKEVDAESLVIVQGDLVKEQKDLAAKKAAIMEKVRKAAFVKDLLDKTRTAIKMVKDPSELYGFLEDKTAEAFDEALMNNVLLENWQTLKEIDDRTTAIEKALVIHKQDELGLRLGAKRDRLVGARLELIGSGIDRELAGLKSVDYINVLTSMERRAKTRGSKCDVFDALDSYAEEMRLSERRIRRCANLYLSMLNDGAPGLAPYALMQIDKDIAWVNTLKSGDTGAWLQLAGVTRQEMSVQAQWYLNERDRVRQELTNLDSRKHMEFVESTMTTLAQRLGSGR